jgi:hypothetical protein
MGHALQECWRVLKPSGGLLDIRPRVSGPSIEILANDQSKVAGPIDDWADLPDDEAADKAIAEAARRGDFVKEFERTFKIAYYWETIGDMQNYIDVRWSDSVRLPDQTLANVTRLMEEAGDPAQIRILLDLFVARYRKPSEQSPSLTSR